MFSFIEDAIGDVIKQILGQSGMLGDLVMAPIRAIVQQVTGGIWKGNGADKFVNDMTQNILPKLEQPQPGKPELWQFPPKSLGHNVTVIPAGE